MNEPGFYHRTGTWLYLPLGIGFETQLQSSVKLSVEFEYDHILNGAIRSDLSNVSSQYEDIYLEQSGNGISFNLMLSHKNQYQYGFLYETWNLEKTNTASTSNLTGLYEPKNNSKSIALKFGYNFY